jgi:hypothetical protein
MEVIVATLADRNLIPGLILKFRVNFSCKKVVKASHTFTGLSTADAWPWALPVFSH